MSINFQIDLLSDINYHPDYIYWYSKMIVVDDCYQGASAVKARAIDFSFDSDQSYFNSLQDKLGIDINFDNLIDNYLPPPDSDNTTQNKERYRKYVQMAYFLDVISGTVETYEGMLFKKPPESNIEETEIEYLKINVDGSGTPILQQSRYLSEELFLKGRIGLLVDVSNYYDENMKETDKACIKPIAAEQILDYNEATTPTGRQLTFVKFITYDTDMDEASVNRKQITYINYLVLHESQCKYIRIKYVTDEDVFSDILGDSQTFFDEDAIYNFYYNIPLDANGSFYDEKKGVTVKLIMDSQRNTIDFIPFIIVGASNNNPDYDEIPMYKIANTVIAHFRNSADSEESARFAGQATLVIDGLDVDDGKKHLMTLNGDCGGSTPKIKVGSRSVIALPEGASAYYLQTNPTDKSDERAKEKIEQLQRLGADLIMNTNSNVTATEVDSNNNKQASTISLVATNISAAYRKCFTWIIKLMNVELTGDEVDEIEDLNFELNSDFSINKLDPQIVTALNNAVTAGNAPIDTLLSYIKKQGYSLESKDEQVEEAKEELNNNLIDGTIPPAIVAQETNQETKCEECDHNDKVE